jgi:hypothetical protein
MSPLPCSVGDTPAALSSMERHATPSVFWLAKTKNGGGLNGFL